ncbi:MAG: YdcF family protein [Candidatus Omnitrophica bacterium]|nr:YdcF family protein [Candidatus Omnitrophota bacterium]
MKKLKVISILLVVMILTLPFIMYALRARWLPSVAEALIVSEPVENSDLIVVLSGINIERRIRHGAQLYHKGLAPVLFLSGSTEIIELAGIDVARIYANKLGVPDEAIVSEKDSRTTFENAIYLKKYMEEKALSSFILVTSPLHSRRVKIIFERVMPKKFRWSVSCPVDSLNLKDWWHDVPMTRQVLYEYLALAHYFLGKQTPIDFVENKVE